MQVPVCRKDNSKVYIDGDVIGIWSIAPALGKRGSQHVFTAAAWSVRSAETGICVGCFTQRSIAVSFANMLVRDYGDISEAVRRCYDNQETDADNILFDEIQARSMHQSRVRNGMRLQWVKPS